MSAGKATDTATVTRPRRSSGSESEKAGGHVSGLLAGDGTELTEQVARIVHELRSPLAGVSQAIDILERTADRPPDPNVLGVARRQVDAGLRRVEQLLVLLRNEGGRSPVRPVARRLRDLVLEVTDAHHLAGSDRRIEVDVEPRLWVRADPVAFSHVLENLVHNGLRHTPDGTGIAVIAEGRDEQVLLRVVDQGPGIDPGVLEHAFEPFVRGSGGGAGLGLTIVRHLVEAQDGRVWVEIDPDAPGTCLVVALPAVEPPTGDDAV